MDPTTNGIPNIQPPNAATVFGSDGSLCALGLLNWGIGIIDQIQEPMLQIANKVEQDSEQSNTLNALYSYGQSHFLAEMENGVKVPAAGGNFQDWLQSLKDAGITVKSFKPGQDVTKSELDNILSSVSQAQQSCNSTSQQDQATLNYLQQEMQTTGSCISSMSTNLWNTISSIISAIR